MLIAYLTTDEVNQELALEMAQQCGITLCPVWPRDSQPDGQFDGVLYDWDYLPVQHQQQLLAELLSGLAPQPAALHSFNLPEDLAKALRERHVAVHRRLE